MISDLGFRISDRKGGQRRPASKAPATRNSKSEIRDPRSQIPPRRGFTLIELLIGACVLTIILGLAISLSRHVRGQSARVMTNDVLARLEKLADIYAQHHGAGAVPLVMELLPPEGPELPEGQPQYRNQEQVVRIALRNNREFMIAFRPFMTSELFGQLPLAVHDPTEPGIRDAWGTPIALIPRPHRLIGMAPRNAPFFVSAGPDRNFLTLQDNLYSYEAFPRRD